MKDGAGLMINQHQQVDFYLLHSKVHLRGTGFKNINSSRDNRRIINTTAQTIIKLWWVFLFVFLPNRETKKSMFFVRFFFFGFKNCF